MKVYYEEQSKRDTSGILLVGAFVLLALLALAYSGYRFLTIGQGAVAEIVIEGIILFVLLEQALGVYTYKVTDEGIIIEERGLLGSKETKLLYEVINGIHPFRQSLTPALRYRYKYRKLSSVDARPVWALSYSIISGKKIQHGRILLKVEPAFFEALEPFLQGRVAVKEDVVVFHAYIREDAHKHGEDFTTYAARVYGQQEANSEEN